MDWGLALSGGGIRSASFSIGVMKALYDKGLLDDIDVISSVSGGGFASYWLFSSFDPSNTSQKFGEAAFGQPVFLKNVCELQRTSDFFPAKAMLRAVFRTKGGAFSEYEKAIERSFGYGMTDATRDSRKLNFLTKSIEEGKTPYFIFNTTVRSRELNSFAKVFELTPKYIGNPVIGFYRWRQNDEGILGLTESVTMSAAAVEIKLRHPIQYYAPHILGSKDKVFELADGGLSENLAALPLIRRGVKNIIIVDAEHDPYYEFGGYTRLKEMLEGIGIAFSVPDVEAFMTNQCGKDRKKRDKYSTSAVSVGAARSLQPGDGERLIDSRIFYIKMSKPTSVI